MNIKNKLQNTQNNWLLYFGGVTFLLLTILGTLYFIFNNDDPFSSSRDALFKDDSISFFIIGALALLVAPIFEELSFRGFFTNKKWVIITGSVILPFIVYSSTNNFLGWIFLATIYSLVIWNYVTPSKYKDIALIILTSLLFAICHYKFSDFVSINTYIGFLYKLFIATIAIWITQNFGITRSMLFHASNNLIAVLPMILFVQFPDTSKQKYEDDKIIVTWNRVPRLNSIDENFGMNNETKSIKATNFSASEVYNINNGFLPKQKKTLIAYQTEPLMRYNFNVTIKNKTIDIIEDAETYKLFNDFLIKGKLVSLLPKE